jgi:Putative MetA-pathway of phenol degradation
MKIFSRSIRFMIAVGCAVPVFAADHENLEEGLPAQVEDAYPTAFRNREVQGVFSYDRTRDDKDRFSLEPRIELGIAPNTQFTIRAPFYLGNADKTGSGDIGLSALYNFNTECLTAPAFAIAAEGDIPTGRDSRGFDTMLKLMATKTISRAGSDRVHLNLEWIHNAGLDESEREHRYVAILGYSRRLTADTILVADFVRQEERQKSEDSNVLELGVRWQLTPLTLVSFGAGAGIGRESPLARATLGFQKTF